MAMLSFPAQSLHAGAVQVDGNLDPADQVWLEGDTRPARGIRVTGRLSSAGAGRYYFSGKFAGAVTGECGRCLEPAEQQIGADSHLLFADAETENDDDPDVFPLTNARGGANIDLRPALRELWLLEVPAFMLCRPDCKGLCPNCGANLNQGACSCARKANE